MGWTFINKVLSEKGLRQIPLEALIPDCNEYDVMLYQHHGTVSASADGFCNEDQNEAAAKFSALFHLAAQERPQLLVTPEYSCPWSVIGEQIQKNRWPPAGKAWVVGCESIRPDELEDFRKSHDSVTWLVSSFSRERDQVFLDAACIFMTATDAEGNELKVLAVQAKGHPMADRCHSIEPDSLILGKERFILTNDPDSIHLAVFICSDALEQNIFRSLPHSEHFPYIVLHIQLNPDPRHLGFREYRDFWGDHDRHNIEIICLNWAKGTEVLGDSIPFGGSAWYYKSSDVTANDGEVNDSHRLGAYYAENRKRYFHCHVLNYAEHVFQLRCCKVRQTRSLPPTHRKRTGPRAVAVYSWEPGSSVWQAGTADDGFSDCCNMIGDDLAPLTDAGLSPVDKERLVCLSNCAVNVSKANPWPHVRSLPSFEMTADEVCQRVTFCHDPDEGSCERRKRWLHGFGVLKNEIMSGAEEFPAHLRQLQADGRLQYPVPPTCLSFNVADSRGEFPAVFVYLGEVSERCAREKMSDLGDILGEARRSLVVWFRQNGQLRHVCPSGLADLDANLRESPKSIVRESST